MTRATLTGEVPDIQGLVGPLGIELPKEFPDYSGETEDNINKAFATEVDRLIGDQHDGELTGELADEDTGVVLSVASARAFHHVKGDGDPFEPGVSWNPADWEDHTLGTRRQFRLVAPLSLAGYGVDVEIQTGLGLDTRERYKDFVEEVPSNPRKIAVDRKILAMRTPRVTTPAELAFGIQPTRLYSTMLSGYEERAQLRIGEDIWTSYLSELRRAGAGELDLPDTTEQNRIFGAGIEVLKAIDPDMLTLRQSN